MPPTQMMSWGRPAACSVVTGARAVLMLPLALEGVTELVEPLLFFQPWSGVSGGPWAKSDGSLCRGCRCFVRAMSWNMIDFHRRTGEKDVADEWNLLVLLIKCHVKWPGVTRCQNECWGPRLSPSCSLKCVQISNTPTSLGTRNQNPVLESLAGPDLRPSRYS